MRAKAGKVLVGLVGWVLIAGYAYLWFNGWAHPLARLLGVYEHRVTTLDEYCQYLRGKDLFRRHDAHVISFDWDALRDQYTEYINGYMRQDPFGLGAFDAIDRRKLGAWRSGDTLHLASDGYSDHDAAAQGTFSFWVGLHRVGLQRTLPKENDSYCHEAMRKRLFSQISLHGEFPDEVATLSTGSPRMQP